MAKRTHGGGVSVGLERMVREVIVVIRSTAGSGRSPVIPEKGVPTVGEAPLTCNRGEAKISVSPWVPSLTWQASK